MNSLSDDVSADSIEPELCENELGKSEVTTPAMWIGVVSLFPEMFDALTQQGVVGRAVEKQRIALEFWNPRDYATDRHRSVDDRPYGGG
ncbi:MAG TPA: tRNA (guanosine(37)-N1)-methyltransferase TrmD, partial [Halomonas sp.]|nr:tRNA (guanosine(37)-N1)-methyltransferase TrmD [Halomonas sp.]